nr:hypothetical protein CFP56_15652 [Quercus suber]
MSQIRTKGNSDFFQEYYYEGLGADKDLGISHHSDLADSLAKTTRIVAAQIPQKNLEMGTECMVEGGKEALGSDMLQET